MRDTFVARLIQHVATNPRIMLITGDLGFGVLTAFAKDFPDNYLNAGVAEQNMTGLATGLALGGRTVFTYSIANFPLLRCLEQLRNDAAYHDANVKVVSIGGGFSYGALGMSHHATEDLAITRALPNLTVVAPGCKWEAEEATSALIETPGPAYLRIDKSDAGRTNAEGERFVLGKARILRDGKDITLITTGGILGEVIEAARLLESAGIGCRVLSMHTLKPFDHEAVIAATNDTGGIITVEEHVLNGGLAGAVAEACLDAGVVPNKFKRLGIPNTFIATVGSQAYLRKLVGIDSESIAGTARQLLAR